MLYDLRCEYLLNPLGIETPQPRLSWKVETAARGWRQTAYQVLVASSPELLGQGVGDVWDSGRMDSDQSIHVPYAGPALTSRQRCYWTVRVWGPDAVEEATAAPACWEMGLLQPRDWRAEWIGAGWEVDNSTSVPSVYLRRNFTVRGPVVRARVYATALGLYALWLNGQRVGEALFTPGWTDYRVRAIYQSYDVTELVQAGANALGGLLGDGWNSRFFWRGERTMCVLPARLRAQLELVYADGSTEIIASDGQWTTSTGPILLSEIYHGEDYDARLEMPGWNAPGFDDSAWTPARVISTPAIAVNARMAPPVRRMAERTPQSCTEIAPGTTVFDLGQNMVGWARLVVPPGVPAGTTIRLRFAEILDPNGAGTIYTANMRKARAADYYTTAGRDGECFEPHFTFHGFRYVEVSGLPVSPSLETITGVVIHSDTPPTGDFACSNPLLNQLQSNIQWGQRGNFLDVPTDCPQRDERLGWTGDAQVFIRTAAFNMDVAAFFTKWLRDLRDAQAPCGAVPMVVPDVNVLNQPLSDGGPAWADAAIICPWTIYRCYGDTRVLAENYDAMARYLAYLYGVDHRTRYTWGDWLDVNDFTEKDYIGMAFTVYDTRLMIEVAEALGKTDDAAMYRREYARLREMFRQEFVTPNGRLAGDSQTAHVLALAFDLVPEEFRARTADYLVEHIHGRDDHLSTGFVGTSHLLHALTQAGYLDVAYTLLLQQTFPSWLYAVTQGATTIWERWDSYHPERGLLNHPVHNSFNHYAYGAVGSWLYQTVAGIDLDPAAPGYRHTIIHPRPGGGLQWAKGALNTVYGTVKTHWALDEDAFTLTVTIPANTSATVILPTNDPTAVREGDRLAQDVPEITPAGIIDGCAAFAVGSGSYAFRVPVAQ